MNAENKNMGDVCLDVGMNYRTFNKRVRGHGEYFNNRYLSLQRTQKTVLFKHYKLSTIQTKKKYILRLSYTKSGFINWWDFVDSEEELEFDENLDLFLRNKKILKYILESREEGILIAKMSFFIRLFNSKIYFDTHKVTEFKSKMSKQQS